MSGVQSFLFNQLSGDTGIVAACDGAIFDALPSGTQPELAVLIGAEDVIDVSDKTAHANLHRVRIEVVSRQPGFAEAKDLAALIRANLTAAVGAIAGGDIRRIQHRKSTALRDTADGLRRIILNFELFLDEF